MDSCLPSPETPDSQEQPSPSTTLRTTRDHRIARRTALRFGLPYTRIRSDIQVTERQIKWAKTHQLTPTHEGWPETSSSGASEESS